GPPEPGAGRQGSVPLRGARARDGGPSSDLRRARGDQVPGLGGGRARQRARRHGEHEGIRADQPEIPGRGARRAVRDRGAARRRAGGAVVRRSSFTVSVLTDEITQDFGRACEVAAKEFGVGWVELRAMHGKNVMNWDAKDVAESRGVLEKFGLRVSEIASPIFKTDW